jgi:hypothetical protein
VTVTVVLAAVTVTVTTSAVLIALTTGAMEELLVTGLTAAGELTGVDAGGAAGGATEVADLRTEEAAAGLLPEPVEPLEEPTFWHAEPEHF